MPITRPSPTSPGAPPPPAPHPAPPAPPAADPARAGAVWVTGTGAFLLISAATVFVATRWSVLSDQVKFAILASVTGACLLAGRRLRPVLPATAGVVFHLGALLLPVNVAALLADANAPWPWHLLVQGAVAAVAFTVLARTEDSIVLRTGAAAGVVVFAAGVGATAHVPAALVLVAFALVAAILGRDRLACAWATIAGAAPVLALAERYVDVHANVVLELDVVGRPNRLAAVVVGGAAALVIGRTAARCRSVRLAALAGIVGSIGVATTWIELDPSSGMSWAGAAALFLVVEVTALLLAGDAFWRRPSHVVAGATEGIVGAVLGATVLWAVGALGYRAGRDSTPALDVPVLYATGLAVLAWLVADLRRRVPDSTPIGIALLVGSGWWASSIGVSGAVLTGTILGSPSFGVDGIVLLALAAFFVLSGRTAGHGLAVVLATLAPAFAGGNVPLLAALAAGGGLTIGLAAIVRAGLPTDGAPEEALALAGCSVLPVVTGAAVAALDVAPASTLAYVAVVSWLLGVLVDRAGDRSGQPWLGWLPRAVAVATLGFGFLLRPAELAGLATALTFAAGVDAVRRNQPALLGSVAVTLPIAVAAGGRAVDASWGTIGVALCLVAVLGSAVDLVVPRSWRFATLAVVASNAFAGLVLTLDDPAALGAALIVLGGAAAAMALGRRHVDLAFVGGGVALLGTWVELSSRHVAAIDAYAAPVAALLLAAGWQARHRSTGADDGAAPTVGSWVAYAPAVATLGGAALVERATGGGSVHALVAGIVGAVAVVLGGARRLSGPLFVGTAVVVAATAMESVPAATGVPTPVWLALGGTLLVGAGIAMERHDTGPVETGRRVVDVIHERFS